MDFKEKYVIFCLKQKADTAVNYDQKTTTKPNPNKTTNKQTKLHT